ncbi:hypothetical protein KFK09_001747 [Dendrobium nobile]|uniref:Reverse transcriptase zinc-binding domain-containing protein n=1 Tax=Dendrobium nobile TaxID=94219 RepID=A0A8T3C5U6_DENNO|nr:hypothetical protein KFK09_001747 [Dendrobium nobile]
MELWSDTQIWKPSLTWKVIHDGAKALRPIIRWKIGNGQCIDMLHDCWILDRKIALWPTFVNVDEVENVKVSMLLNDSFQWKEEEAERYFGKSMAERVMSINTGGGNGIDCAELIHSQMNLTITTMAYRAKYGGTEYQYSWMNKLKLHPRESFFWWRLLRDAIPTNFWLSRRGLRMSPSVRRVVVGRRPVITVLLSV